MKTKLRVLHLAKFYPPERGGMERALQQLCESTEGVVENLVLAAHTRLRSVRERVGTIDVTRAGCLVRLGSLPVCPSFARRMARTKADVVVLHEPNAPALVADLLVRSRRPLVVWYHADLVRASWIYDTFYRPLLQRALRRASCVIVSSQRLADHAEGLREVRGKCVVVPFGIDVSSRPRFTPPGWLARFIDRQKGPWALSVGRMVPYKGIDVLLEALALTSSSAVFVGSGPQLERYKTIATRLGLSDKVLFAGNVTDDELTAAYQHCDLFVLPSVTRQEAFGMVQLEAMACSKPVISTDLPTGVPWVNQHGETGLVVPPRDVAALADAIKLLVGNTEMRRTLGAAARRRVLAEFTADGTRQRVLTVYEKIRCGQPLTTENISSHARPAPTIRVS